MDSLITGDIYGGKSRTASDNNTLTFSGGTARDLIGGGCETAAGNTVTIGGGTVRSIYGAKAETRATGNHVYLGGGKAEGDVYGGWSESPEGRTQDNDVTLYGGMDLSAVSLYGGNLEATGNTLTIGRIDGDAKTPWTGGNQEVGNLSNFESIHFAVVPWNETKAAVTIAEGGASDLSGTKIDAAAIHFTGGLPKANQTMTLLDESKVEAAARAQAENITAESTYTAGTTTRGTGTLSLAADGSGNVIYTVGKTEGDTRTHHAVMAAEAGMEALAAGVGFIRDATEGLSLASNIGADGVSTYAKMGGGRLRQQTGSHADVHVWNAILAIGHENKKERGAFGYGAFFEYGTGNYSTFDDDGRGDGSMHYTGGGLLAKWTDRHGFYVEGSLRAGTMKDDARNVLRDDLGNPHSYETDTGYFGAQIGVGKEIALANGDAVDVYGRYSYTRRNGVSFDGGGHYDLDAVTSQVMSIGARYVMKREKWNFYGGLAYEHELDGKAGGTADGFAIRSADVGGGSVKMELGATMRPGKTSPWSLNFNVNGFAGKKQGVTGGVSVSFTF